MLFEIHLEPLIFRTAVFRCILISSDNSFVVGRVPYGSITVMHTAYLLLLLSLVLCVIKCYLSGQDKSGCGSPEVACLFRVIQGVRRVSVRPCSVTSLYLDAHKF